MKLKGTVRPRLLLVVATLLVSLFLNVPFFSRASGATLVAVWSQDYSTSDIFDPSLVNGSIFVIDILGSDLPPIMNATEGGLNGFDFTVNYDPGVLRATQADVKAPLCLSADGCLFDTPSALVIAKEVDSVPGTTRIAAVLIGTAVTGNGILFRIQFQVVGEGLTRIDIRADVSQLVGPAGGGVSIISYKGVDGSFNNTAPPSPGFSLTSDQTFLNLMPRDSRTVIVTVTSIAGFSGNVSLSVTVVPDLSNGTQAVLNRTTIGLDINNTANTILMVSVGAFASPAVYSITVRGTSGSISDTITLTARVGGAVFIDDFNDNSTNLSFWTIIQNGIGPSVNETNERLEMDIPANSQNDPATQGFGAVYESVCKLRGDYDIQVDFVLLVWPSANGVRVGLGDPVPVGVVERVSLGNESPGLPREVYLTHFIEGVRGITATSDLSGALRLARSGGIISGYYLSNGNWTLLYSGSTTLQDATFGLSAWSHDAFFADQNVRIAFDNFQVNAGELVCPGRGFDIATSPTSLNIPIGSSATSIITLQSTGGFSGNVDLTATTSSPGLDAILDPYSVNLTNSSISTSTMTVRTHNSTYPGFYTITVTGTGGNVSSSVSVTVNVTMPNQNPIAYFVFSPSTPSIGDFVSFDGSLSYDPDGFIVGWFWTFGDGNVGYEPYSGHVYSYSGNYSVTLVVTDNQGASGSTTEVVHVRQPATHDVAILAVSAQPSIAVSGQLVGIQVILANNGLVTETVDVTVYFDSHIAATITGITMAASRSPPSNSSIYGPIAFVQAIWDTQGVSPGNYTISATAFLASDENPGDNSLQDGQVTILPPPVLNLTPSRGSLGTKVIVQGSGFPLPPYGPGFSEVLVSFDDMFMGFAIVRNGEFNFTLNVPHSEPGLHEIKAFDALTGARSSATFEVLPVSPEPKQATLSVSLDVGAIYFLGENADIYVLVNVDGTPATTQLQLKLTKPDGSTLYLNYTVTGPGTYKASFNVPGARSTGTYAIVAVATHNGVTASALRTFEVKQSWIVTQTPRIATASALLGILAVIAVAWRKGYIRRKPEEQTTVF